MTADLSDVRHPEHYQSESGLECWDAMELIYGADAVRTFCRLNVMKYLWRLGKKDDPEKELKKIAEYARHEEEIRTGEDRHRSDIHYLQKCRNRLRTMMDDLDREIVEIMAEKEAEKRGIQRRL